MPAFSQQLRDALPALWRYAFSLTRDQQAADDLVQDTVERALRKRHLWLPGRPLKPWLMTMLLNLFRNDLRRARIRQTQPLDSAPEPPAPQAPQDLRIELAQTVERIEKLDPDRRDALLLVVIGGLNYTQAAKSLGIPTGTLMSRISRARAELRKDRGTERNIRRVK